MREIALATGVKNKEIIDFLHANIQNKIDFCKTIITSFSDNNFVYLLFACDSEYELCEKILRESIIEYIESVYKVNYLKENIKNPLKESLMFNAYIKVLAVFDRSTDETALNKIILFNQTFFVDSFLAFRLEPLKNHWKNLATLSSDNMTMFNSGTFIDVIKFLINTMDNNVYKIKIICKNNNFCVYNMKNKNAQVRKLVDCSSNLDLITNVLNSCPTYIDFYVNNDTDNEIISFFSSIFTNRLKIYMKN